MKQTLLEESFEDWQARTHGSRDDWRRATVAEWDRLEAAGQMRLGGVG